MSSANLDLVRSIFSAWERGDYSSAEWAHPEIEFVVVADGPSPGSWTGVAAMAEAYRSILSGVEDHRTEAEEYRELEGERVLVLFQHRGRGKASGMEIGQMQARGANLFTVSEGKVTKLVLYWDGERALADLDLASEARSTNA